MLATQFLTVLGAAALCGGGVLGQTQDITSLLSLSSCSIIGKFLENNLISQFNLRFYYGMNRTDYLAVPLNRSTELMTHKNFKNESRTVFYLFGFTRSAETADTRAIIEAYISTAKYNLVVVDWSAATVWHLYGTVVSVMPAAAVELAKAVDSMVDAGVELSRIVGHSLGAQLAGHIGKKMKHIVRRITGLDPAGSYFYPYPPTIQCARPMAATDALCVEAVHTDSGVFGGMRKTAKNDYYVNGGLPIQPGCLDIKLRIGLPIEITCSHDRAVYIWAEVVRNSTSFLGRQCGSLVAFNLGRCNSNPTSYIGHCDSNSTQGNYYLTTNDKSPFGRGRDGATRRLLPF